MTSTSLLKSNNLVSTLTISFFALFLFAAVYDMSLFSQTINALFGQAAESFGSFWQWLMVANLALALGIAASPFGRMKLGRQSKPDISAFRWISMIMCTLLAGGGVFWSAAEPVYHFLSPSPAYGGVDENSLAAATAALSQSFLHWGFLAWAVLGTLATVVLMHAHYEKG